jgi:hypothetical protein
MKVYSLYHKGTYVASFPKREDAVDYGKEIYADGWDCDILEEYLSKSPLLYSAPYTLTPSQTIPCNPGISPNPTKFVHTAQPNDPKPYFDTYGGVKAE